MFISFDYPWYLFFLVLVPGFIIIHFFISRLGKKKSLRFANFEAIKKVSGIEFYSKNITVFYLSLILVLFLCFALAGLRVHYTAEATEFSYVIVIDSSRSMEASDLFPSRIEVAKHQARQFVENAPTGTKFGVVSFAGAPRIHAEVSEDKEIVKNAIDEIELDWVGGTNILDAVISSSNLLRNEEAKSVILLGDGQINIETVQDAIDYANDNDVIVHTFGVGTQEGGETSLGVISKLDKESLEALAYTTEGYYFDVESKEDLAASFNNVLNLTRKKVSVNIGKYLLMICLVLFILVYYLLNTAYKRIP